MLYSKPKGQNLLQSSCITLINFVFIEFFLSSLFCEVDRIKFLEFINMHLPMLVCFKISILGVDLKHIYIGLCIQILSTVLATALCTEISCRLMNTRKRLIHRV